MAHRFPTRPAGSLRSQSIRPPPGVCSSGAAGGGVWMSTNDGVTFAPLFDAQPTLAIGALAVDTTTTPPRIFAGTGEGDLSGDSYYGLGVFESTDLGQTWIAQNAAGAFTDDSFARIAIDTSHSPSHLFGAVAYGSSSSRGGSSFIESNFFDNGIWRSTDGGTTWSFIPLAGAERLPAIQRQLPRERRRDRPGAARQRVRGAVPIRRLSIRPTAGVTWSAVSFPAISNAQIGRASLAARNGTVYAALGAADGVEYLGFFKSIDSGATWAAAQMPGATLSSVTIDGTSSGQLLAVVFRSGAGDRSVGRQAARRWSSAASASTVPPTPRKAGPLSQPTAECIRISTRSPSIRSIRGVSSWATTAVSTRSIRLPAPSPS